MVSAKGASCHSLVWDYLLIEASVLLQYRSKGQCKAKTVHEVRRQRLDYGHDIGEYGAFDMTHHDLFP